MSNRMSEWANDSLTQRYCFEMKISGLGSATNWYLLSDTWRPPNKVLMCEIITQSPVTEDFWQWVDDKPNLLECLAATQTDTSVLILYEFLSEGTLEQMLKTTRMGEWDLFHIMRDVFTALVGLVQEGKAVMDLKPANIHLKKSFDEGFQFSAKLANQGLHLLGVSPASFIQTPKETIFAFGAIYFYALTGKTVETHSQAERIELLKKMGVNPETSDLVCACLNYSQPEHMTFEWVSLQLEACLVKWIARKSETRRPSVDGSQVLATSPERWTGKYDKRFANGDSYWGDWLDGVIHGQGIFTWSSGVRYEGRLEHGVPQDPKGLFIFPDGSRLQGNVVDGIIQGEGRLTFQNGDHYSGNFKDDRFHGRGRLEMNHSGIIYEGYFLKDRFHGEGKLYKRNKEIYVGEFFKGLFHNKGRLYFADGDSYEGQYFLGARHGKGVYYHMNGDKFDGDYRYGRRTGYGTFTSHKGSSYTGEFIRGKRHGKGRLMIPGVLLYDGSYKDDKFDGYGVLRYTGGRFRSLTKLQTELLEPINEECILEYEGDFYQGQRSGKGNIHYIDGSRYSGEFLMDMRHGQGEHRPPEEASAFNTEAIRSYKGSWANDLPQGKGTLTIIKSQGLMNSDFVNSSRTHYQKFDRSTYDGTFIQGQATGEFEVLYASGDRYLGMLKNGIPEGQGRMDYITKYSYEGSWRSGMREGKGTYTDPQGSTSEGTWKENLREGEVINRWPDGKLFKGTYHKDKKCGKGVYTFPNGQTLEKIYNELDSASLPG